MMQNTTQNTPQDNGMHHDAQCNQRWLPATSTQDLARWLAPAPQPDAQTEGVADQPAASQPAAVLVLWGGAHCGVCQVLRPRLAQMAAQHFPQLPLVYVDCQASPPACAQYGVFSLPVLRLYLHGQMALEYARAFGVQQVLGDMQQLARRLGPQAGL